MKLLQIALAVITAMGSLAACDTLPRSWRNTPRRTFHCDVESNAVVFCRLNGTCKVVDECGEYAGGLQCKDNGKEVFCAGGLLHRGHGVREVEKRNAKPQANRHWECSKDRASVLICAYGFCSTDKYCRQGTECKDDCICCKDKKKAFTRDMDAVTERGGVSSVESFDVDFVRELQQCGQGASECDKDLVSSSAEQLPSAAEHLPDKRETIEDKPAGVESMGSLADGPISPPLTYGSCKENQKGVHSCRRDQSTIVVCDPADMTWKLVAECPKGVGCCYQGPVSGTAFCRC